MLVHPVELISAVFLDELDVSKLCVPTSAVAKAIALKTSDKKLKEETGENPVKEEVMTEATEMLKAESVKGDHHKEWPLQTIHRFTANRSKMKSLLVIHQK